jgi:hypothetical protein
LAWQRSYVAHSLKPQKSKGIPQNPGQGIKKRLPPDFSRDSRRRPYVSRQRNIGLHELTSLPWPSPEAERHHSHDDQKDRQPYENGKEYHI